MKPALLSLILFAILAGTSCPTRCLANGSVPPSARELFNAGTRALAATNFADAEQFFRAALATQDEFVQPLAEFNLGSTRFADGLSILKKGPDAQKIAAQGEAALAIGERALQNGDGALNSGQINKMVAAYIGGRGARQNLREAEKAVKSAMQTFGKTLTRWQRSADDFQNAAELNPADTNAQHNAQVVQHRIAELVDMIQKFQQMLGKMAGQKDQLGKMLSKLKGQIPAPNAPPGGKGEGDEDEDGKNGHDGDIRPESLAGKEEGAGREGQEMQGRLSPDQAGKMLDNQSDNNSKHLPMGGDQPATNFKEKKGKTW